MLKFENVSKVYNDGFKAVDSVNFEIPEGEFLVHYRTKWFWKINYDEND